MSWQQTLFYSALTVTPAVLLFNCLESMGVFRWVNRRLNEPAPPSPKRTDWELLERVQRLETAGSESKNDIDKLKLALSFKEFKSKG